MNSLNLISARVIGTPTPSPSQSRSQSYGDLSKASARARNGSRRGSGNESARTPRKEQEEKEEIIEPWLPGNKANHEDEKVLVDEDVLVDEKTPLLDQTGLHGGGAAEISHWRIVTKRILDSLLASMKLIFSTLTAPSLYVISYFYDEDGAASRFLPIRSMSRDNPRRKAKSSGRDTGLSGLTDSIADGGADTGSLSQAQESHPDYRASSDRSSSSATYSESEQEPAVRSNAEKAKPSPSPSPHTRSKSTSSNRDEIAPSRRSIRIKLHSEDSQQGRKGRKKGSIPSGDTDGGKPPPLTPATLKSPTSPASSSLRLTKFPRMPQPPRPLIPRRQLPNAIPLHPSRLSPKTLILDLDETLIHSLSKGGRMSTGHMVEVKLNALAYGPQHPILYYVHKRPHCDEFLRRVSQWYNLVVFTASVQEYADPVINWLETDRTYFSKRFYRQHCTFRNGNYIKDLSAVEPDLSRVMIVDNSPTSYAFHEDNGIPIEGWINDPTDNDLLHLVPLLEGLHYVTDVRALLGLRLGEVSNS